MLLSAKFRSLTWLLETMDMCIFKRVIEFPILMGRASRAWGLAILKLQLLAPCKTHSPIITPAGLIIPAPCICDMELNDTTKEVMESIKRETVRSYARLISTWPEYLGMKTEVEMFIAEKMRANQEAMERLIIQGAVLENKK